MLHNTIPHTWPLQDITTADNVRNMYYNGEGVFTDKEIDSLIERVDNKTKQGSIGSNKEGVDTTIDTTIRNSKVHFLEVADKNNWPIYEKLTNVVNEVNNNNFFYNLMFLQELQYTRYDSDKNGGGHYGVHRDGNLHRLNWFNRKLSFSLQLTDCTEYEGGELSLNIYAGELSSEIITIPKKKGLITFFPSDMPHEVHPVTKGTRRSLVGWVMGSVR